jgi:hypothetical protein
MLKSWIRPWLAVQLAKRIDELIAEGQSVFIRGCSIQDNFLYV